MPMAWKGLPKTILSKKSVFSRMWNMPAGRVLDLPRRDKGRSQTMITLPLPPTWKSLADRPGADLELYPGPGPLLPELHLLGRIHFHRSLRNGLPPCAHPGTLNLAYLRRGHVRWQVGRGFHAVHAGQVCVVRPGEICGGEEGHLQPAEQFWLRLAFPERGPVAGLGEEESDGLRAALAALVTPVFPAADPLEGLFARLLEEHRSPVRPQARALVRALVQTLLITVLRQTEPAPVAGTAPKPAGAPSPRVAQALAWLDGNLLNPDLKLSDLARESGLSAAGLRARFKAETGYTPHEYLMHHRMRLARERLAETRTPITQIARELGFSSSQYFATVFGRHLGLSPGEFRARKRPM